MFREKMNATDAAGTALLSERYEDVVRMQQLYNAAILRVRTKLEILEEDFRIRFDRNPIHHIESRLKTPQSIAEKLTRKGCSIDIDSARENLHDIAGVRVICYYLEDIYDVASILLAQDDVSLLKQVDYNLSPKESGYRSLHLIIEVPVFLSDRREKVAVELQIRTIAMDFWASLEHQLRYKSPKSMTETFFRELRECADSISDIDGRMQQLYKQLEESDEQL